MTGARRAVSLALVALAALAASATSAACARAASRQPFGFALSAVGFRSYFQFRALPGQDLTAHLRLIDRVGHRETVEIGPAEVSTAAMGGLAFGSALARGRDGWLHLPRRRVRLFPGRTVELPISIHVPAAASPGEHFLGIVATPLSRRRRHRAAAGRISLHIITRLAMTAEVNLPGPRHHRLRVGRAGFLSEPAGAFLTLQLADRGNTLIVSTAGVVTVHHDGHTVLTAPIRIGPFVPHTAISLHLPWSGVVGPGRYVVTGVLHPVGRRAVRFRRVVRIRPRVVAVVASRAGTTVIGGASQTPLELGIATLGLLLCVAIAGWRRESRRVLTPPE